VTLGEPRENKVFFLVFFQNELAQGKLQSQVNKPVDLTEVVNRWEEQRDLAKCYETFCFVTDAVVK
jgi:hypothetical protein